jgi:hypothetical protein
VAPQLNEVSATVPLRLRPLEIGDLLDETFRMYRRHFLLFAGLSVILSIPEAALSSFSYYTLFSNFLQTGSSLGGLPVRSLLDGGTIGVYLFGALITLALVPFFYGAVTYAACESALGRPVTPASVLSGVLPRYFPLLGYWLLIGLMLIVFCLIPLWIWIWVGWAVVMPVMFIEHIGLGAAMGRSRRLVEGRWWRTFFTLVLMLIIWFVARTALRAFIVLAQSLLQLVIPNVAALWIAAATSVIVGSLVNPLLQIAIVLVYLDLRVRREGLDLFQLAQRVTGAQPAQ